MNKLLLPQDVVGGSFWLISVAMIGAAIFFITNKGPSGVTKNEKLLIIFNLVVFSIGFYLPISLYDLIKEYKKSFKDRIVFVILSTLRMNSEVSDVTFYDIFSM